MNGITVESEATYEPTGVCQAMASLLCKWDEMHVFISIAQMVDDPQSVLTPPNPPVEEETT